MKEKTAWDKFGEWLFGILWPRLENDPAILKARLEAAHKEMQSLYWEGKAKEMATSRIAQLEDVLWRACVAIYICGQEEAARKFCEESGIRWDQAAAERWRASA